MAQRKNLHKSFLTVANRLVVGAAITSHQARTIKAEAKWVQEFMGNKVRAAASRVSPGRKKLPDDQVSAASLKKREYRERVK